MNIILLFQSLVNYLSNILENNLFLHELEHNIFNSTKELNLDILKQILEYLDLEYKNSKERKDKYHVQQTRERTLITSIADSYLRNRMIDEFKLLVNIQIEKYPEQKKDMIKVQNFFIDNIEGIINQKHSLYKCPCSMEGHISNKYSKFITSKPHAYSEDGLENIVQLLTMKANKIKLTEEIYSNFKFGVSTYKQLNLEKYINKFRIQANKLIDSNNKYNIEYYVDNNNFSLKDNYRLDYFLSKRT